MIPLNERCEIYRPIRTADGRGGFTATYKAVITVPCRISGATGKDKIWAGSMQDSIDAVLYCNPGVDIRTSDKIVVRGESYIASPVSEPSISAYRKAGLRRVQE